MKLVNVIDLVKVKQGLAAEIKHIVTNEGFYKRGTRADQFDRLNDLKETIFEMYNLEGVEDLMVVDIAEHEINEMQSSIQFGAYDEESGNIVIKRMSIITFLTSIREVMYQKGVSPQLADKKIDKKAWACRAFQLACPNSFEKSVKNGRVVNFVWDDELNKAMMKVDDTVAEML